MNQKKLSKPKLIISLSAALLLFAILTLFIKFPYYVKGPCQFSAQRTWSLNEVEPGKILSRLSGNNPHRVQDFSLLQFDRPDFVNFSLSRGLVAGQSVRSGELIGTISSTENKIRLNELQGQLQQVKAQLNTISTGEKAAIQQQAEQELNYAKAALELFQPLIERKRQLFNNSLISQDEWDQVEAENKLLELNVAIAKAKLKSVQSGEKIEATEVFKTEISSLENQIRSLEAKLSAEAIRTPIRGILLDSYQAGILCSIADIDTMIAQIPVSQNSRFYIEPGMKFQVKISGIANQGFSGQIVDIGQTTQMVNNRMMFILTGTIDNSEHKLLPGMTGYVKIFCEKIPLWDLIKRWWLASRFIS